MAKKTTRRDKGNSFLRVFSILEEIVDADRPLTATEASKLIGLPVPTTYRLCKMLVAERLLQYEIDGKRMLGGSRLFEFAGRVLSSSHLDLERRAILEALVNDIGETCNISIPDGTRMIYAERVEARWPLRMQLPAGAQVPLHATASGKLYLSQLEPSVLKRILSRLELTRNTQHTIADLGKLETELKKIRKRGYSSDDEEFIEGLVAVSVPINDPKGRFCAGLAVHAPKSRLSMKNAVAQLPKLRSAAAQIAGLMKQAT